MSSFKDIAKGGWKPNINDGKFKEKIRKDFKGIDQVAGWIGKGRESSISNSRSVHPISSLKDPSTFQPPPKKIGYDNAGNGYSLQGSSDKREPVDIGKSKPSPKLLPTNTEGTLSTNKSHAPLNGMNFNRGAAELSTPVTIKPSPPKLPPRAKSNPTLFISDKKEPEIPPGLPKAHSSKTSDILENSFRDSAYKSAKMLRQPPLPPLSKSYSTTTSTKGLSGLDEDQNRLSHKAISPSPKPQNASEGTSFAQKQAVFKTANSLRNNPSSVSFSDAKMAARTANNFRERHGNQVKSGLQLAQKFDKKYSISDKIGSTQLNSDTKGHLNNINQSQIQNEDQSLKKKPPPPPPPAKRLNLTGLGITSKVEPPPIPKATKPKF